MKLENLVVSLELAQKLKELGVKQESLFNYYWQDRQFGGKYILRFSRGSKSREYISAFTVAELGEMLPSRLKAKEFQCIKYIEKWVCGYWNGGWSYWYMAQEAKTEADARAKMLIYLIENNPITVT